MSETVYSIEDIKRIVAPVARRHGVDRVYLFGSYARGGATAESDVDLCVEAARLRGLFALSGLRMDLEEALDKDLKASGAHLCASVSHDVLTLDGASNGQDLDNFLKVFDRLIISTATYSDDVSAFLDRKIDSTIRFVPQMTWAFGGASVILDPAAPTA